MLDQTEKVTGETIKQSYRAVIPGSGASLLGILIQIRIKVRDGTGSPSKWKFWSYMGSKWSHVGQRTLKMEPWKSVDQWLQIRITSMSKYPDSNESEMSGSGFPFKWRAGHVSGSALKWCGSATLVVECEKDKCITYKDLIVGFYRESWKVLIPETSMQIWVLEIQIRNAQWCCWF